MTCDLPTTEQIARAIELVRPFLDELQSRPTRTARVLVGPWPGSVTSARGMDHRRGNDRVNVGDSA